MFIMQNATSEQKSDKNFVIKAVARPCVVTGTKYIPNPSYDPIEAFRYHRSQRHVTERSYRADMRHSPGVTVDIVACELQFASPKFQDDKEVVLAAVHADGRAIKYASPRLQQDPEVKRVANRMSWPSVLVLTFGLASLVAFPLVILSPLFLAASITCAVIGIGIGVMDGLGFFSNIKYQQKPSEQLHNTTVSLSVNPGS